MPRTLHTQMNQGISMHRQHQTSNQASKIIATAHTGASFLADFQDSQVAFQTGLGRVYYGLMFTQYLKSRKKWKSILGHCLYSSRIHQRNLG